MTIGVATLGNYGEPAQPIIVLAADRMLTAGVREYEPRDQTKAYPLSPHIMVLISGYGDSLLEICWRTHLELNRRNITNLGDAAYLLADKFSEYRNYQVERRVLAQYGLNMDTFLSRQREFEPNFLRELEADLDDPEHNIGTAIIAGVDEMGANIYTVSDPGIPENCGQTGFATIGTGAEFADPFLMSVGYTRYFFWTWSLILTYAAKKKAESAAGVGKGTDLWWITKDGTQQYWSNSPLMKEMERIYNERQVTDQEALLADHSTLMSFLNKEVEGAPKNEEGTSETQGEAAKQGEIPESPEEGEPED